MLKDEIGIIYSAVFEKGGQDGDEMVNLVDESNVFKVVTVTIYSMVNQSK